MQAHPDWTVNQMRRALTHSADLYLQSGGFDPAYVRGYGILDAGAALSQVDHEVHCAAKTTSPGCPPWIDHAGTPSASAPAPFDITAGEVPGQVFGLLFYGTSGSQSAPFLGGTLCVAPPITRTSVQQSGGQAGALDCSGSFALEFNAEIQSGGDPNLISGAFVDAQYWFRDPPDLFSAGLSDAIRFTIQP